MKRIEGFLRRRVPLWLLLLLTVLIGISVAAAITVYTLTYYAKAATAIVKDDDLIFIEPDTLYIAVESKSAVTSSELDSPYSEVNNDIIKGHYVITFIIRENKDIPMDKSWKVYVYFRDDRLGEFVIKQEKPIDKVIEGVIFHIDLGLTPGQEGQLPSSDNSVRIIALRHS